MNDAEYVDALSIVHLVTENQFPAPISTNLLTQPSSGTDKLRLAAWTRRSRRESFFKSCIALALPQELIYKVDYSCSTSQPRGG